MSRSVRLLRWLEDKSDWLSPLVVKEVRQVVRSREFSVSFGASLAAGMVVAFFGAADALSGTNTSGRWTFIALMSCLGLLGLAVVPLGAFGALRTERLEQTLELITLTALSSRRVIVGKLLSQVVKLATLFAAMAPFITMSFLLGGIDLVSILVSLVVLFMASVWVGALCLLLSTAFKSRATSSVIFIVVAGVVGLFVLSVGQQLFRAASRGMPLFPSGLGGPTAASYWWIAGIVLTFWLASLVNLILLAENRLSLPTEDSVTPLRLGFLVQFLLIAAWALTYLDDPARAQRVAAEVLSIFGLGHLAVVAYFTVTEDLGLPRRVLTRMKSASRLRWLLATFGPGGGRAATYLLAQMTVLLGAVALLQPTADHYRSVVATCGYICFFSGVPVVLFRLLAPGRVSQLRLRVAVLVVVAAAMTVPDILYYVVVRPEIFNVTYSARHLINPFFTVASWNTVESRGWIAVPFALGLLGLLAQLALIRLGARATGHPVVDPDRPAPAVGETGRGGILY